MTDSPAQALAATVRDTLSWIHTHPDLSMDFQREAEAALASLVALADGAAQLEAERDALRANLRTEMEFGEKWRKERLAAEARVTALEAWGNEFGWMGVDPEVERGDLQRAIRQFPALPKEDTDE